MLYLVNRAFLHDIAFTILVSQNNKTAATLVTQTSPVGVEPFLCRNVLLFQNIFIAAGHVNEKAL